MPNPPPTPRKKPDVIKALNAFSVSGIELGVSKGPSHSPAPPWNTLWNSETECNPVAF